MIQLIVGKQGSGKTKELVNLVNQSAQTATGNIVSIEKSIKYTLGIHTSVRLISTDDYKIDSFGKFYGFIQGILAGNYDISEIYVDDIFKICGIDFQKLESLIQKIALANNERNIKYVITLTDANEELPESLRKYL